MNVSGVVSSIKSFSELWDSEDASTLEKMTSLLGILY
jgi:hypothetical protein